MVNEVQGTVRRKNRFWVELDGNRGYPLGTTLSEEEIGLLDGTVTLLVSTRGIVQGVIPKESDPLPFNATYGKGESEDATWRVQSMRQSALHEALAYHLTVTEQSVSVADVLRTAKWFTRYILTGEPL